MFFSLCSFLILCPSCKTILIKIVTNRSIVSNAYYLQKDDQKVIYLPMVHVSKPKNYEEVKNFIDKKRKLGYRVYYEKVTYYKDSANFKEASLKMRKSTGLTFGQKYLSDEQRKFRENVNDKKHVWQSTVDYGLGFKNDIHADYTLTALVKAYEDLNGEIKLEDCDYDTSLDTEYKCATPNSYQEVVQELRNAKLVRHLLDTTQKKKLVVYGMGHYYSSSGVFINLYHYNKYKEVKARDWVD
jgi:hypothetical protein